MQGHRDGMCVGKEFDAVILRRTLQGPLKGLPFMSRRLLGVYCLATAELGRGSHTVAPVGVITADQFLYFERVWGPILVIESRPETQ